MGEICLNIADRIHQQNNKFALGMENKSDSKLNDSPANMYSCI